MPCTTRGEDSAIDGCLSLSQPSHLPNWPSWWLADPQSTPPRETGSDALDPTPSVWRMSLRHVQKSLSWRSAQETVKSAWTVLNQKLALGTSAEQEQQICLHVLDDRCSPQKLLVLICLLLQLRQDGTGAHGHPPEMSTPAWTRAFNNKST